VRIIEDCFPLVLCLHPRKLDEQWLTDMAAGYDRLFQRAKRYALLIHTPDGVAMPGGRERKRLVDWANEPTVRKKSRELCVGSAIVLPNALARGALTAITWFYEPPAPMEPVPSIPAGLEWCFQRLDAEKVAIDMPRDRVRRTLEEMARTI
jgi:hypothetical protein